MKMAKLSSLKVYPFNILQTLSLVKLYSCEEYCSENVKKLHNIKRNHTHIKSLLLYCCFMSTVNNYSPVGMIS